MKRSAALSPLSHDHHHALEAALQLRRAGDDDLPEAVARFTAFWEERGRAHFDTEERILLPALPAADADWQRASVRVRAEHDRIRALARALAEGSQATAHELGQLLHDHVRYEEHEVFGLAEQRLTSDALARLGEELGRADGAPGVSGA